MSVAGIIGSVSPATTLPVYFRIRWRIYDVELCSLANPVTRNRTLTMNPMDAQRYDLSRRCSVSL